MRIISGKIIGLIVDWENKHIMIAWEKVIWIIGKCLDKWLIDKINSVGKINELMENKYVMGKLMCNGNLIHNGKINT